MMRRGSYLVPACVAAAVIGALYIYRPAPTKHKSAVGDESPFIIELPHGRVLYVVVDEDGVYVGEEFIPFVLFEKFVTEKVPALRPDFVMIFGTDASRYGKLVQIYATVRHLLQVPVQLETRAIRSGTRRGPIEVHKNHWEYE